MDGLLIVDKPAGWTSHDVVARVRRLLAVRRVGHAGTLDPLATGVLPLGVGRGTRVLEYLSEGDKAYRADIRLGAATTTDDADGAVVAVGDTSGLTDRQVRGGLARFVGPGEQVPPAFSAIKQAGTPLYRLARAGKTVEPAPRRITIHAIDVRTIALPDITVDVTCSKGTYIRALARDLGAALGCYGHLTGLRRLRTGPFGEQDASTLQEIEAAIAGGVLSSLLLPVDRALSTLATVSLNAEQTRLISAGIEIAVPPALQADQDQLLRAYNPERALVAILRASDGRLRPHKVFLPATGSGSEIEDLNRAR